MREEDILDIKTVQDVELGILKEFHRWCIENDAIYSVTYGTLIGAVRHQGFIPWDNDIDVMMPRPDYERFVKWSMSNKLNDHMEVLHYDKDEKYHSPKIRVVDTNTFVEFKYLTEQYDNSGLWIDIFPLDGYDPEKKLREKYRLFLLQLYRIFQYDNKDKKWVYLTKKVLKLFLNNKNNRYSRKVDHLAQTIPYEKGEPLVADLLQAYPCFLEKKNMDSVHLVPFEDTEVYAIPDYDEYLKYMYGDYMTPPPVEKRKVHRIDVCWRGQENN